MQERKFTRLTWIFKKSSQLQCLLMSLKNRKNASLCSLLCVLVANRPKNEEKKYSTDWTFVPNLLLIKSISKQTFVIHWKKHTDRNSVELALLSNRVSHIISFSNSNTRCARHFEYPTNFKILKEPLIVQKQILHPQKALDISYLEPEGQGQDTIMRAWQSHRRQRVLGGFLSFLNV